jgi:hypothetical protein
MNIRADPASAHQHFTVKKTSSTRAGIIAAGLFAAASAAGGVEENFALYLRPAEPLVDWRAPAKELILSDESYQLELALNPLKTAPAPAAGDTTRNVSQDFALTWRQGISDDVSLSYEASGGYQANWQDAGPQPETTAQQGVWVGQKISLAWKWMKSLTLTPFVQGRRFYAENAEGPSGSAGAGIESSSTPWDDATLRAQIAVQEKFGFNNCITTEQITGGTFEQKLPATPFKLKLAGAASQAGAQDAEASGSGSLKGEGGIQWTLPGGNSLAVGASFQETSFDLTNTTQSVGSEFADLRLQPADGVVFTTRTAWETRTADSPLADAQEQSAFAITFGLNWQVMDALKAGLTLQHRIPQQGQPADAQSETVFSFSASGNF